MLTYAIICYAIALVIPVAAFVMLLKSFKREQKLSPLHMIIGAVSFIALVIGTMVLIKFVFAEDAVLYMRIYMPEWLYKTGVSFLFFLALCAVRYFVLNSLYFNRDKTDGGVSFLVGFGFSGAFVFALYCLYNFLYVGLTSVFTKLVEIEDSSLLVFSDGASIAVMTPFWIHIAFSVLFTLYAAFMLSQIRFMSLHSSFPYKPTRTLTVFLITAVCESITLTFVLLSISNINFIAAILITAVLAAASLSSVIFLYKYNEDHPYNKQFD
ncbi:MAG: hypothetical protein IJ408_00850 [Clostridia bacterium]|nr:hypothetical protein [Clostridia bacterium]